MTRRLASWLLLLLLASSGAYATPAPRTSPSVRVEYSFVSHQQAKTEHPVSLTASAGYPAERPSWHSTSPPRARAGNAPALFQRPPPAAR